MRLSHVITYKGYIKFLRIPKEINQGLTQITRIRQFLTRFLTASEIFFSPKLATQMEKTLYFLKIEGKLH